MIVITLVTIYILLFFGGYFYEQNREENYNMRQIIYNDQDYDSEEDSGLDELAGFGSD